MTIHGICGLCGGRVTTPSVWFGTVPPVPTCESCGAMVASHGPVLPMEPRRRPARTAVDQPDFWSPVRHWSSS